MAELGFTCPPPTTSAGTGTIDVDKQILVRTGGCFENGTPLSLENPGAGWSVSGAILTYSGADEFVNTSQTFHNGDLLVSSTTSGNGCDVQFVSASGSVVAFGFNIDENDVVQVWKFAPTSGTT